MLKVNFADDPVKDGLAGTISSHREGTHIHAPDTAHWAANADELGTFGLQHQGQDGLK